MEIIYKLDDEDIYLIKQAPKNPCDTCLFPRETCCGGCSDEKAYRQHMKKVREKNLEDILIRYHSMQKSKKDYEKSCKKFYDDWTFLEQIDKRLL